MNEPRTSVPTRSSGSRHRLHPWILTFTAVLAGATITAGSATSTRSAVTDDQQLTEYRALRRMYGRSDRFNQEGWLDAWTELDGQGFRYRIVTERGSEYLRNKVFKPILDRERDLIAGGQAGRAALTEANYVFGEEQTADDGYRYVLLKPKRKDVTLVDGRMVLSPEGTLLRIEGRLAKNPSFWTSLVNVTRHFATIDGVRVPVSTESIAKVKFAGQSRLDISYQYESINGRPVTSAEQQRLASARASAPQ